MVGVKGHIRNNADSTTTLHAQLETHCNIPHTVPQVLSVDEFTTTKLNNPETPVNVPLNLHVKSPCNHENIDRGVNDENSINNITPQIIATKSDGKYSGETEDNKNQCVRTSDIVPKTGPDIYYEGKEVNRVRDNSVKNGCTCETFIKNKQKWNKVKKIRHNLTKKSWEVKGKSKHTRIKAAPEPKCEIFISGIDNVEVTSLWHSYTDDHRGQLIADVISNSDHITLNTNTPTRVPNTTLQQKSSPEITTVSNTKMHNHTKKQHKRSKHL